MSDANERAREATWAAKREWNLAQVRLPLREKFRILLELQRQDSQVLAAHGVLRLWERPSEVEP